MNEETMKRNLVRGEALRVTMKMFEGGHAELMTSDSGTGRTIQPQCHCSIRAGDVSPTGRLKHRSDCGQNVGPYANVPEPPTISGGLRVNGEKLAAILIKMIADQADGDAEGLKSRIVAAAGIDASTLSSLLAGKIDFPRREWLESIASTLDVSAFDLFQAADADTAAYRQPAMMGNVRAQDLGVPEPPKVGAVEPLTSWTRLGR